MIQAHCEVSSTIESSIHFESTAAVYRDLDVVTVIMCHGRVIEVEGSGRVLLRRIMNGHETSSSLASFLALSHDLSYQAASNDVNAFLDNLARYGIVSGVHSATYNDSESSGSAEELRCWQVARDRMIPLKCKLNLTYRCNLGCAFCYNGQRPGLPGHYKMDEELTLEEYRSLFSQLYTAGTFFLTLTGGEPLARADLPEIVALADEFDFATEILSNGTLLKRETVEILAQRRLQIVIIPLFGSYAALHDGFVGQSGAFERAVNTIRLLVDSGIAVGVRCSINCRTFTDRERLRAFVNELGARYFPHVQIHKSSDGILDARDLRLSDQQLSEVFKGGLELNSGYSCEVAFGRVDIMPNGDVALCSILTSPLGNIRNTSFADVWYGSPQLKAIRYKLAEERTACTRCSSGDDTAYRCSADAQFDDGGLDHPSTEALRIINVSKRSVGRTS
jgi:MoaA/NifB/PqqE/SkfB family radical SAM enzyme